MRLLLINPSLGTEATCIVIFEKIKKFRDCAVQAMHLTYNLCQASGHCA